MRYFTESDTLFIRGDFRAASTGIDGGLRPVSAILNHTVRPGTALEDFGKRLEIAAAAAGIGGDWCGLVSTVPTGHACVLQYDFLTVFVAAGIRRGSAEGSGSVTIIVSSSEGMSDAALIETIMVAAEAKAEALVALDLPLTGTPADGVIAACEGEMRHDSAGRATEAGKRIREAVLHGLSAALNRHDTGTAEPGPAFFIYSRLKGGHWIEWKEKDCPYYPCHFEGQSCDFCYCPFYPCRDERLGQWADSSGGGRIWNCAKCTLLHQPAVAAYLKKYPGALLGELQKVGSRREEGSAADN